MDNLNETKGKFVQLHELSLDNTDRYLITRFIQRFTGRKVYFLRIDKESSQTIKLIVKPSRLFPFLVKIGDANQIEQEYKGYQLIRLRVPPLNIPPLENFKSYRGRSSIVYRYITGGLVKDSVNRVDNYLSNVTGEKGDALLSDLFDVVLKNCHWKDGNLSLKKISLPDLPIPEDGIDPVLWQEIEKIYLLNREKGLLCKAPHGIIHGDLHPKNVLATRHHSPVIIDFMMVQSSGCVYWDYCKFEVALHLQTNIQEANPFWSVSRRMYSNEPLILPRSNQGIARYIHTIRSTIWRTCLSKSVGMSSEEIDIGYRAHLLFYLASFYAKSRNSSIMRQKAYDEIKNLSCAI